MTALFLYKKLNKTENLFSDVIFEVDDFNNYSKKRRSAEGTTDLR